MITDLGTLGRGSCFARAIDPTGQYIVGMSGTYAGPHGFIHDAQGMHDLGVLAGVAVQDALAVNRHGHAAVMSGGAGYWNGQAVTRVPGVGSHAVPAGLNGRDEMVVVGDDGAGHRLFLFEGRTGIVTAIEPLVVNTDGWCFCTDPDFLAVDIADGGAIVGQAKYNGVGHGYMLVPVAP